MTINNHKKFSDWFFMDYQYQLINWYQLSSFVSDCHWLSISSIVQVLENGSSSWLTYRLVGHWGIYCSTELFSCGISVIQILTCGIAVSLSLAVCSFSSFWLMIFSKWRPFMVFWFCSFVLSCVIQVIITRLS